MQTPVTLDTTTFTWGAEELVVSDSFFRFVLGIRLFFNKKATDADEAFALSYAKHHIDIYSNSWGPGDKGFEVVEPGHLTKLALEFGTKEVQ